MLDEASSKDRVTQIAKELVHATKCAKRAKLRLQLEELLQRQSIEYKRNFNAEILLEPLQGCELASRLFLQLKEVGMIVYGYIHHTRGLEAQVLTLDNEDINIFIRSIGKFLEAKKEEKNPAILGVYLWLSMQTINVLSDIYPDDLKQDKHKQIITGNLDAVEEARAWRAQQWIPDDYTVYGPYTYQLRTMLEPNPVRIFLEAGDIGILNMGDNPYYAEYGAQELDPGSLMCSVECGATVVYVAKKS